MWRWPAGFVARGLLIIVAVADATRMRVTPVGSVLPPGG